MLRLLLITAVFMAIVISAVSQYDHYFEYHNTKSQKLNSTSLKRLVGKTWYGKPGNTFEGRTQLSGRMILFLFLIPQVRIHPEETMAPGQL